MHDATLCLVVLEGKEQQILLGMKKRGFGKGRYNGFGGKPKPGESVEQAAIRELVEESGVRTTQQDIKKAGEITFRFPHIPSEKDWDQVVHIYLVQRWDGEPKESEEMRPEWFSIDRIPYAKMWDDDKYWLPKILRGEYARADFIFDEGQKVKECKFY
jgi:8-oxo-dGTP pyrophosphatase MutT (NUDIX family)